jgi:myosin heavy subunit
MSTNQRKQRRKNIEVERLTKERDEAREEAAFLRSELSERVRINGALIEERNARTAECDEREERLSESMRELRELRPKAEAYVNTLGQFKHLEVELRIEREQRAALADTAVRLTKQIEQLQAEDKDAKKLRRRLAEAKKEIAELRRAAPSRASEPVVVIDGPTLASVAAARAAVRRSKG